MKNMQLFHYSGYVRLSKAQPTSIEVKIQSDVPKNRFADTKAEIKVILMEIKCVEKTKDELRIELSGKNHLTLANVINENLWQQTGVVAAFSKKHPQIDNTEIIIQASSPKTKLLSAAEKLVKDAESLKKQVK